MLRAEFAFQMPKKAPSLARLQAWLSIEHDVPDGSNFDDLYDFFASKCCFTLSDKAKDALYDVLLFLCVNFQQWATSVWLHMKII
jgi:hypothetical protein